MSAAIYFASFNNAIKLLLCNEKTVLTAIRAVQETKCAVICTTLSPRMHFTFYIMTQSGGQLNTVGLDSFGASVELHLQFVCPCA